jgi:hypothetical protein
MPPSVCLTARRVSLPGCRDVCLSVCLSSCVRLCMCRLWPASLQLRRNSFAVTVPAVDTTRNQLMETKKAAHRAGFGSLGAVSARESLPYPCTPTTPTTMRIRSNGDSQRQIAPPSLSARAVTAAPPSVCPV